MIGRAVIAEVIMGVREETPEVDHEEEAMPRLCIESEGIEFAHLLFLPQTAEFVFCLQIEPSVETPEKIVEVTLEEVHAWVLRFSQLYR